MRKKPKLIPEHIVKKAEELAMWIREEQQKGRCLMFPPNINTNHVLLIALNLGLQKLAEEIGYEREEEKEREVCVEEVSNTKVKKYYDKRITIEEVKKIEETYEKDSKENNEVYNEEDKPVASNQDKEFLEKLLNKFS